MAENRRTYLSRRAMLKTSLGAGGTAALGLLLHACGAAPAQDQSGSGGAASGDAAGMAQTQAAPPAEAVQLTWIEWGDINDKAIADAVISDFQSANPDITVQLQQTPDNYYEKLQATIAGGVAADIINTQTWRFQTYAAKNVMAPLDDMRSADGYNDPYPEAWQAAYKPQTEFRGKLFGVPWNMNGMVMFYSKQIFDAAGVQYPTDDWTYDEFVALTKQLTGDIGGTQTYGYQTNTSYERLACWMRNNGDKEWDTEVEPKQARWDQPHIMDMLNFQLYEVVNILKASPTPAAMQGGTNQLQSGNVAMKVEGPWFLPQMAGDQAKREGGTPFDVVLLPKGPDGNRAHMVFGHVLTMNAATKAQDAAWTFLKFAGSEAAQKHVAAAGRQPVTPELNASVWAPQAEEKYQFENADAFIKAFETGIVHLAGEVDDTFLYNELLKEVFDQMVAGGGTAQDLIPDANQRIQKILDDYWAKQ